VRYETIGSYLHRLAEANHLNALDLTKLIGLPRAPQRHDNRPRHWNAERVNQLAALAGRPPAALTRALPALADLAVSGPPPNSLVPGTARLHPACRLCAVRRGIRSLVILDAPPHQAVCGDHHRWLPGGEHLPIGTLPGLLGAARRHRRLHRRIGTAGIGHYAQARELTHSWFISTHPTALHARWAERAKTFPVDPYGDPHRPSRPRIEAVTYPETVTLAALLANDHASNVDFLAQAVTRLGLVPAEAHTLHRITPTSLRIPAKLSQRT
jgi:hypothetical protein